MGGLANLLQAFSDAFTPIVTFLIWLFPIKIYLVHEGERCLILSFGKVRRKKSELGPGVAICFSFEEGEVIQVKGRYINLTEQTLMVKGHDVVNINGSIEFSIYNMKKAVLEIEEIDLIIEAVCMNNIREYACKKTLKSLGESDKVCKELAIMVNKKLKKYGAKVNNFIITDLRPHDMTLLTTTLKECADDILCTL